MLVPGGFGQRGIEGKIAAAQFARENKVPYLGICLGMQVATIEYARNVAGLKNANSTEFEPATPHPVIALITEWKDADGPVKKRDENPTWAAPCAWVRKAPTQARHAGRADLRRRGDRAASPPL